jgi:tetratricopeptide (TPR) repeat protein
VSCALDEAGVDVSHRIIFITRICLVITIMGMVGSWPAVADDQGIQRPSASPAAEEFQKIAAEGNAFRQRADYSQAEKALLTGLGKAKAAKEREWEATFDFRLSQIYGQMSQFDRALDYSKQALELRETLPNRSDVATTYDYLGTIYLSIGQLEKARDHYSQALEIFKSLPNPADRARSYYNLGLVYHTLGQLEKARDHYTQALELRKTLPDRADLAASYNNLGTVDGALGQLDKALEYHLQALEIRKTLPNRADLAASYSNLGLVYRALGQFEKALEYQTQALEIFKTLPDRVGLARIYNNLGTLYWARGQLEKALESHTQALEIRKTLSNPATLAISYENLGLVYHALGQLEKARDYHTQALEIFKSLPNRVDRDLARSYLNLGNAYWALGQWDKALENETQAVEIFKTLPNRAELATSYDNLGLVYQALGQLDKALEYHLRALEIFEKLPNPDDRARSHNNLGLVCQALGRLEEAQEHQSKALEIRKTLPNRAALAVSYNNLGAVYQALGQLDKARDQYAQALEIFKTLPNRTDLATGYTNLGAVYQAQKEWDKALENHLQALEIFKTLPSRTDLAAAYCYYNLGATYWTLGQRDKAIRQSDKAGEMFDRAVQRLEASSDEIQDPTRLESFRERSLGNLYQSYASLRYSQNRFAEALSIVERGRAQALARLCDTVRAGLPPDAASRLKGAEDELRLASAQRYHLAELPEPSDPTARQALQARRDQARARQDKAQAALASLRKQLLDRYPRYRQLQGRTPLTLGTLAALAQHNPETLYLEWLVQATAHPAVFALSQKDGLRAFPLSTDEKKLQKLVGEWRQNITQGLREEQEQARELYQAVLGPVERAGLLKPGRYRSLVLVSDGPLLDLPFAALLDTGEQRLGDRYLLATAFSLRSLTWQSPSPTPSGSLFYAADPLGQGEEQGREAPRGAEDPLPYARSEARYVAQLFPGAFGLAGLKAREAEVKRRMPHYALLHFATHGVVPPDADQLGTANWLHAKLRLADGWLEASDILELSLSARLAVLSGCVTGEGKKSGAEGLMGLAWAFRAAGCPSVVASLWEVDDWATALLTRTFYQALRSGKRKDEALRVAMRAVRSAAKTKDVKYAHPKYWAGFEVIGDTSPLPAALQAQHAVR